MWKIRLIPKHSDGFLFREGLELDRIYEIDPKRDIWGYGEDRIFYVKGKGYCAFRFEVISEIQAMQGGSDE